MGQRLREAASPGAVKKWREAECPTCQRPRRVVSGAWLRECRLQAGLSQRAFGELVGVSGPYVSDLETNRRECPESIQRAYSDLRIR